jgi:bla regulator protein BlaR1
METFSFGISSLLLWLIDTTKYITCLICLIFIIKALTWKKLPAWWYYGLWLLLILRMLMPWVPESRLSMFNYVPAFKGQTSNASALKESFSFIQILINHNLHLLTLKEQGLLEGTADIKHRDEPKHGFRPDLNLNQALFLVWLSGVIGVGLCVVFKNIGFWIVVRKKSPVIDQGILDQLEACKREMKIRTEVSLVMTHKVKSPALFGYIHPQLLLPEGLLERLDQGKLRYVFLHELAHLKRHDIAISWLATVLQAIHWFNPFVWYAFYQMRIDQEIACDAYVLSQLERDQSTHYAHTLVGLLECFHENRQVPALAGILESKSRIRRRIITIVQNRQYSKTLSFSAVSLFLVIGFTFFTTGQIISTGKTPNANDQQRIIDLQPKATDGASPEAMTRDDSGAWKGERVTQETKDDGRAEISVSSSNKTAMNDMLTRSNEVMPKIEGEQDPAEHKQIADNELTEMVKDVKPSAAQSPANRQEAEEQVQTVLTTSAQRVSTEKPLGSTEQYMSIKDAAIVGDELDETEKDGLVSEQKPDVVQEAKTQDKGAKDSEDAESILYETQLFTDPEKSDSSTRAMNAYPAAPPRDHKDERKTTTSLLHYLEGSGHTPIYSYEVERSTEETRASSAVKEDPGHSGFEEEPSGKESSDSFEFDEPPRILSRGPVSYPFRAKRLGLTGKVSVSFLVDTNGHATNIEAVKAEPENVLLTFAGAAEEAIAKCRFKPGTSAGEPVPVKVVAPIRFEI